jgi:hypothetical protein
MMEGDGWFVMQCQHLLSKRPNNSKHLAWLWLQMSIIWRQATIAGSSRSANTRACNIEDLQEAGGIEMLMGKG